MSDQLGDQHFVMKWHLGLHTSTNPGDGKLCIYDKSSPEYWLGLPRKKRGGRRIERLSPRKIATYVTYHSAEAEIRMNQIERPMTLEWVQVKDRTDVFGPDEIPAIIRYLSLTEIRRPQTLQGWASDALEQLGIVYFLETLREMSAQEELIGPTQETISRLPCWRVHTLLEDTDEEYVISDRPVNIGFAGQAGVAWEQSLAFIPMGRKKLLVGFYSEPAIEALTFGAESVNGMIFHTATREIYSHRELDSESIRRIIRAEAALHRVTRPNVRLVKLR